MVLKARGEGTLVCSDGQFSNNVSCNKVGNENVPISELKRFAERGLKAHCLLSASTSCSKI